ncbi:DUF6398 domain-containing protein [Legionella bozemanae]|uniref:DUF6398 domain-containing protein n=1 Tax=Legionella bozemanae TaxID=447 RepID=A0A0W0RF48_LEGBO|nr:DUF6398 domain-containing protein [Legionella bozemanae]KTC69595.1 hypothetical protein Lboz_3111 [Legionella bozemanae]STP14059.1 Uncharacterised protein [Legionella bozemanae]
MPDKKISKIPKASENDFLAIIAIIEKLCNEHFNREYYDLAHELTAKLARKKPSPLVSGRSNTWTAGIIHALGMVNFLFDKSQNPHLSSQDLSSWFGLSQSTISAKSKSIRDLFKIRQMDPKWTLPSRIEDNPFVWMVSVNGFIVDVREAPYEIQEQAYHQGIIPYVPKDKAIYKP